jgi:hypothetical protein
MTEKDDSKSTDLRALIGLPDLDLDWKTIRNDPEVRAAAQWAKKEEEVEDIEAFLAAYSRATDSGLSLEEVSESPDAICIRQDGSKVGVEITNVRRSPEQASWERIHNHHDEMDAEEAADEVIRLIGQKTSLRPQFKTAETILVVAICEADFNFVVNLVKGIPLDDWANTGFSEIWLADFRGIREGAHREARLFGLYPEEYRVVTERSWYDQKPYG